MIDNLLQICLKGTFEKLEVAVRVGVLTCQCFVCVCALNLHFVLCDMLFVMLLKNISGLKFQAKDLKYLIMKNKHIFQNAV